MAINTRVAGNMPTPRRVQSYCTAPLLLQLTLKPHPVISIISGLQKQAFLQYCCVQRTIINAYYHKRNAATLFSPKLEFDIGRLRAKNAGIFVRISQLFSRSEIVGRLLSFFPPQRDRAFLHMGKGYAKRSSLS